VQIGEVLHTNGLTKGRTRLVRSVCREFRALVCASKSAATFLSKQRLGYWSNDRGIRFTSRDRNFSIFYEVQTGSEIPSSPMDNGSPFSRLKRPRRDTNNLLPSSADVKDEWSYALTHMAS
jgi:hypothetical protein